MDNRVMVIGISSNGEIHKFGEYGEYEYHIEGLRDYLYTYYNDLAKQIGADDINNNEELVIYLTTLGEIIYLRSFGYGLLYIPKEVSADAVEALYSLVEDIPIHIDYYLVRKNGKVVPQEITDASELLRGTKAIDAFFRTKPYVKKVM